MSCAVESFPALDAIHGIVVRFLGRIPDVEVALERHAAMARLEPFYTCLLNEEGLGNMPVVTAEQVHGNKVALVDTAHRFPIAGADGLITRSRGITLGITVADCAPVWIVAKDGTAGALLHSGKKGTELGIVPEGIRALCALGTHVPSDFVTVIGPCIRPDCYEVDFAKEIRRQAADAGVMDIHDARVCTACHPDRYYSYRRELGLTGRMLATLTLLPARGNSSLAPQA